MNKGDYVYVKREIQNGGGIPRKIKYFAGDRIILEGKEMEENYDYNDLVSVKEGKEMLRKYYVNEIQRLQQRLQKLDNGFYVGQQICLKEEAIKGKFKLYKIQDFNGEYALVSDLDTKENDTAIYLKVGLNDLLTPIAALREIKKYVVNTGGEND